MSGDTRITTAAPGTWCGHCGRAARVTITPLWRGTDAVPMHRCEACAERISALLLAPPANHQRPRNPGRVWAMPTEAV